MGSVEGGVSAVDLNDRIYGQFMVRLVWGVFLDSMIHHH